MKKLYFVALVLSMICNIFPQTWQVQSSKPAGVALYDVVSLSSTKVIAFGMVGKEMISTDAGETWTANSNLNVPNDIWGSYFLSDNTTGWIVGTGGLIMKTTDAGNTWASQTSGTINQLYDIEFYDASNGIAVGDIGTVLTTTDGGTTWVTQAQPGVGPGFGPIYKVAIVPGSTTDVWIGLNNSTTAPKEKLMKSTNFGVSFSNISSAALTLATYSIYIKDASNILIGISSGGLKYTTNGGTTWSTQSGNTYQIYDVKAITSTNAFAVDAKGVVLSTTNFGGSWTKTQTSSTAQLRAVCYNTGFIIVVGNAGNIYKSTDGGTTWVAKYTACDQAFIRNIIFKDDNNGLAGDQVGNLWKTTDGGANWSVLHNFNTSSTNQIYYVSMPTANTWYVACDHTTLWKTTDAGSTFSQITTTGISGTTTTFWSIAFVDDQNGIVGTQGGVVLRTTNGGTSWTDVSTLSGFGPLGYTVNYIEAQGPSTFYLAGGSASKALLAKSTDGGASFSTLTTSNFTSFYTVKFRDKNLGIVGRSNGSILKTTNAGATWDSVTTTGTTGAIYSFVFSGSTVWLCASTGDIAHSTDVGATWTLDKKLTSNLLYCLAISNNNLWISGGEGTIYKGTISSHSLTLNLSALLEAMYVTGGTAMTMAPSVTVELHDASTFAVVESKTATLSTAGVGSFLFTTATNGTPYYIVVKSPTTVETWSATVHSYFNNLLSYDFTSGVGQAYTDGSMDPMGTHSGKTCIYSGDVNQDGQVTSDDFTGVDNDNTNFDYHISNDVNGDGQVTSDDFTFIDNNNTNFVTRQVPPGAPSHLVKRTVKNHVTQIKSSVN
ncbi:MAG: YCF48-related protein [Ignavibacteriaceae bacterium]|nr:YCF48-related protein [Ignavibacteriaceae bacterium]